MSLHVAEDALHNGRGGWVRLQADGAAARVADFAVAVGWDAQADVLPLLGLGAAAAHQAQDDALVVQLGEHGLHVLEGAVFRRVPGADGDEAQADAALA